MCTCTAIIRRDLTRFTKRAAYEADAKKVARQVTSSAGAPGVR
jgi:hypothetical protein